MTEHPIIFSGPMVRAILDGRKTQTRRVIKPQPSDDIIALYGGQKSITCHNLECPETGRDTGFGIESEDKQWRCPYGVPGDRLWVRESFWIDTRDKWDIIYAATPELYRNGRMAMVKRCRYLDQTMPTREDAAKAVSGNKWWKLKPSIHMPRKFCRILLEVKRVWVERVKELDENDCYREGVERGINSPHSAKELFEVLWDSINGKKYPWKSNVWVWCVEFERVTE